jgi:hypothetical protein
MVGETVGFTLRAMEGLDREERMVDRNRMKLDSEVRVGGAIRRPFQ